jgi:antitoxin VapB
MSLNIKDPEIHQLAKELAELTGENMTRAVGIAVKDRLLRVRGERKKKRMSVKDMIALGKRVRSKIKGPLVDHAELLYDERGLPK